MQAGQPSRTAMGAAAHRAIHHEFEGGRIFHDPLAAKLLGAPREDLEREFREEPLRAPMRFFVAARARLADEAIAHAVDQGVTQLVVLGAGLDTFAYRNPHARLKVFEVDFPATQAWKRARLTEAGIAAPDELVYAPIDFERETLDDALARSGFLPEAGAFFSWLGVVPYLTEEAIFRTLRAIAGVKGSSAVMFDYGEPLHTRPAAEREAMERNAARVAALGEPWLSYFDPADLAARLKALGFSSIQDWDVAALLARFAPGTERKGGGGHVLLAQKPARR